MVLALYAFDGTWNEDDKEKYDVEDTNVVRFKELYVGNNAEYMEGVGTRFGYLGRVFGGLFGSGGHTRIKEMYEELCENWEQDDKVIDIVGFSRGAALAVHFANKIAEEGVKLSNGEVEKAKVRFLGVWDIVGSFGLSFNTFINFQEINLGWNIDSVSETVDNCYHAMALDERRETFNVTRLDEENRRSSNIKEVWFRGVHSDIGGGNSNVKRSNIALQWMLEQGRACGLKFNETKARLPRYSETDRFAPISENMDVERDPRRKIGKNDNIHPSALPIELKVGQSHECEVLAKTQYNWSGIKLLEGGQYKFSVPEGDAWEDGNITCGPQGWDSEQVPWYEEGILKFIESRRRMQDANWFALIGALGDEDEDLFYIGDGSKTYVASRDADLYLFANDLKSKYGDNSGSLVVTITRTG